MSRGEKLGFYATSDSDCRISENQVIKTAGIKKCQAQASFHHNVVHVNLSHYIAAPSLTRLTDRLQSMMTIEMDRILELVTELRFNVCAASVWPLHSSKSNSVHAAERLRSGAIEYSSSWLLSLFLVTVS